MMILGKVLLIGLLSITLTKVDSSEKVRVKKIKSHYPSTRLKLKRVLALEDNADLVPVNHQTTQYNTQKIKLQQVLAYYKNGVKHTIPVYTATLVAEKNNHGYTGWVSGTVVRNINRDLKGGAIARISKAHALDACKRANNHQGLNVKVAYNNLIIHPSIERDAKKSRLVYMVSYLARGAQRAPYGPVCLVDAKNSQGRVLRTWEGLRSATTQVNSIGGNSKVQSYLYSNAQGARFDPLKVEIDQTQNCYLWTSHTQTYHEGDWSKNSYYGYKFPCSSGFTDPAAGANSPLSDGYFSLTKGVDALKQLTGVNVSPPLNWLYLYAHVSWSDYMIFYYWGSIYVRDVPKNPPDPSKKMYPPVAADTVGHEMGHGVNELEGYSKMNGADTTETAGIEESFADMVGTYVEYFTYSQAKSGRTTNDYTIGEDITYYSAIRDMCNPVISHVNQITSSTTRHDKAGIYNKVFCNLAKGSLGLANTFKIFLLANKMYWASDTNFQQGLCGILHAANDLNLNTYAVTIKSEFSNVGVVGTCP